MESLDERVKSLEVPSRICPNYTGIETARTYHRTLAAFVNNEFPLLNHVNPGSETRHIVELGCGTGLFTRALYDQIGLPIYAFDHSPDMLAVAKEENDIRNIHFCLMDFDRDMDKVFDDDTVDYIISNCALFTSSDKDKLIKTCSRKLRKGSSLAFSIPPMGPSDLFESYLQLLSIKRYNGKPEVVGIQEAEANLEEANSLTREVCESFKQSGRRHFSNFKHTTKRIKLNEERLIYYLSALVMRSRNRDFEFRQTLSRELYNKTLEAGIEPSFSQNLDIFVMEK